MTRIGTAARIGGAVLAAAAMIGSVGSGWPIHAEGALQHLDGGGQDAFGCVSRHRDFGVGIQLDGTEHPITEPVRIDAVEVADQDGVRVVETVLVRFPAGADRIGSTDFPLSRERWPDVEPAAGTLVRPGEHADLVVHVHRTSAEGGSASGISVVYSQGATRWRVDTHTTVGIHGRC